MLASPTRRRTVSCSPHPRADPVENHNQTIASTGGRGSDRAANRRNGDAPPSRGRRHGARSRSTPKASGRTTRHRRVSGSQLCGARFRPAPLARRRRRSVWRGEWAPFTRAWRGHRAGAHGAGKMPAIPGDDSPSSCHRGPHSEGARTPLVPITRLNEHTIAITGI